MYNEKCVKLDITAQWVYNKKMQGIAPVGFTKYDEDHEPWYGVTWEDATGWIPGEDVELKWSTLY